MIVFRLSHELHTPYKALFKQGHCLARKSPHSPATLTAKKSNEDFESRDAFSIHSTLAAIHNWG